MKINKLGIIWIASGAFVLIIAIFIMNFKFNYTILPVEKNKVDASGTFGDKFGMANALFSGLGILGLIITILLQISEQQSQRDDINKNEDKIKKQEKKLSRQQFESTFFNMVNLHNEIVKEITTKVPLQNNIVETITGRYALEVLYKKLTSDIQNYGSQLITEWEEPYSVFFNINQHLLGHYFRNLYRILKFVRQFEFDEDDQENYNIQYQFTSILRAQLSSSELGLIFYNGASVNGKEKFLPLIEYYAIMKNLKWDILASKKHISLYNEKAYRISMNQYNKTIIEFKADNFVE